MISFGTFLSQEGMDVTRILLRIFFAGDAIEVNITENPTYENRTVIRKKNLWSVLYLTDI